MNAQQFWEACQDLQRKASMCDCRDLEIKLIEGSPPYLHLSRVLNSVAYEVDPVHEASVDVCEEIEENVVYSVSTARTGIRIEYSILFSTTYQVPILYFQIIDIERNINQLQFVYEHLVPKARLDELQSTGVVGGISQMNHPATDVPNFYVHPCRTAEAMQTLTEDREVSTNQYLQIWIGLIGSAVGLNLPVELVL